ncbi:MAG: phosphoglucosamine mutase [Desulfobacteraceae bacterium 4572_130]|nr:MAG: phosphoglucosamine mutase [Desulfobacteraceae bacterium 4572_130]
MNKLFGTDGIRGIANQYPMTCEIALKIGMGIADLVKKQGFKTILIGRDTRISGNMLESSLSAGITSLGVNVLNAGIIPTSGVAFLVSSINKEINNNKIGAGIVISASHNPYYDNGIKIFNSKGYKLLDLEQEKIEKNIINIIDNNKKLVFSNDIGKISNIYDATNKYASFLKNLFTGKLFSLDLKKQKKQKIKIIIDCSNGAAYKVAPLVFSDFFKAEFIFNKPDGKNINKKCGSQHTQKISEMVVKNKADIGFAFDGDADRLIIIDEKGNQLLGDKILSICANYAKNKKMLQNNIVVSTVMSNIGLSNFFKKINVKHIKTQVGDRKVFKKMMETGSIIGGEDSGHIIFSKYHTTGDGIITALEFLKIMVNTSKSVSELASIINIYPQILKNIKVDKSKPDFMKISEIKNEIQSIENELNGNGRVFIRYSGTEPLLRVMVEAQDIEKTKEYCKRICEKIEKHMIRS